MKFILPYWGEKVDPGYNFVDDELSEPFEADRFANGARPWDVIGSDVADGILVSLGALSKRLFNRLVSLGGIRKGYRVPSRIEIIGDCGAWQYRDSEEPPYTPEQVLDMYRSLGVDYGITLDHIPLFGDAAKRLEVTYNNAVKMYELWRKGGYNFTLMASVQGIEIDDYLRNLEKLYRIGYRHFAIGGLAARPTEFIDALVDKLTNAIRGLPGVERVHFLGITRLTVIPKLRELEGIVKEVSFDSSTITIMALHRDVGNYITEDGKAYTAIRIAGDGKDILDKLRAYDRGEITYDEIMKALAEYSAKTGYGRLLPYYAALLRDMPWKKCSCNVCKSIGIEVVIYKGDNRNKRRQFHNVYVFTKLVRSGNLVTKFIVPKLDTGLLVSRSRRNEFGDGVRKAKKVLVVTNCTASKTVDFVQVQKILAERKLPLPSFDLELEDVYREVLKPFVKPAGEMYAGSFSTVKNLVEDLRRAGKKVDLYIISARYGLIREDREIVPYEASLKGKSRDWIRSWSRRLKVDENLMGLVREGGYDLIIAVLPREYAYAVENTINMLANDPRAILIVPKGVVKAVEKAKARVILAGGLKSRLRELKGLRESLKAPAATLDYWL